MKIIKIVFSLLWSVVLIPTSYAVGNSIHSRVNTVSQSSSALTVNFVNNTPAVAHLDYTNLDYDPSKLDSGGNIAYYSQMQFTGASSTYVLEIEQYGAANFFPNNAQEGTCYIQFNYNNGVWTPAGVSKSVPLLDCTVSPSTGNNFTVTMQWPPASNVNYPQLGQNLETVLKGYLANKTYSNPSPLFSNQIPLSASQMSNFTGAVSSNPSGNGWTLQFGYDAIRVPMWFGSYYAQNSVAGKAPYLSDIKTYLTSLDNFVKINLCSIPNTSDVSVNVNGFWAYTISGAGAVDGNAVATAACSNTPALEGPLAMAAQSVGDTSTLNSLVTTLSDYNLSQETFAAYSAANSSVNQGNYTSSSSPYFNATIDLLSEALMIGNGSLDLTKATDGSTPYQTVAGFNQNYQAWLNDGFLANVSATDPANPSTTQAALRVIYSMYNGITYQKESNPPVAGDAPTVSEGMGYGLLISFAANDQVTFDKFLWYVLSTAKYQGCAGMNQDQSACSVKSEYLMPWMVDATGTPFKYAVGGGYMTSGSAYDADSQIVMALYLASQRVGSGAWKNSTFDGQTYAQIATAMAQEINRYDVTRSVQYYGTTLSGDNGVLFTPGSQWGAPLYPTYCSNSYICGTDLIYPGYISPQAFQALNAAQSGS